MASNNHLQRELATTPLNFEYASDMDLGPHTTSGAGDILDPVPFGEGDAATSFLVENDFQNGMIPETMGPDTFQTDPSDARPASTGITEKKNKKRPTSQASSGLRRPKKKKGVPKRPLSAYNLFFQSERAKILEAAESGQGDRLGFEGMAKIIARKWKALPASEKPQYDKGAEKDSIRYQKEMEEYNKKKNKRMDDSEQRSYENLVRDTNNLKNSVPETSASLGINDFIGNDLSSLTPGDNRRFDTNTLASDSASRNVDLGQSAGLIHRGFTPQVDPSRLPSQPYHQDHAYQYPSNEYGVSATCVAPRGNFPPASSPDPMRSFAPSVHAPSVTDATSSMMPTLTQGELPVPEGMEIVLADRNGVDRRYKVQYTCYPMSREAANQFVADWSRGIQRLPPGPPLMPGSNGAMIPPGDVRFSARRSSSAR